MRTHNDVFVEASPEACLVGASDVERWPEILPHYRAVEFTRRDGEGSGRVLMKAFRDFGVLPYPIWWESEMETDPSALTVRYEHVRGITRGMDVEWRLTPERNGTHIEIVHEWAGPPWPLIGTFAARRVIGPHFVHVVAARTLEGVKRAVESARSST